MTRGLVSSACRSLGESRPSKLRASRGFISDLITSFVRRGSSYRIEKTQLKFQLPVGYRCDNKCSTIRKPPTMRSLAVLVILLGTASGYPKELPIKFQEDFREQASLNSVDVGNFSANRSDSWPQHLSITLDETDENFLKLIELFVELSEADYFRDDGFPRSKRGIWEDALAKMKETYHKVAIKVKESVAKVKESVGKIKDKFHRTLVDSGFKEKMKEFFDSVVQEFNIDNMCRNVQKLNSVLRGYPIDDKISTLMSFLDIIFCQLSKDSETGFRELTENPKYERLMSEKDASTEFQKLMDYINELDNIKEPDVPEELLASSSELATSKAALIFAFGGVFALSNVVQRCQMFL